MIFDLLAQIATDPVLPALPSAADWGPTITGYGSTGFAIWYAWYVTTKVIPDLVKQFRDEMQLERDYNQKNVDKLWVELRADNMRHIEAMNKMTEAFETFGER